MKSPIIPENESERLQTLYSLNIIDTKPEERFDRITRIAKKLFDVPIAVVSLIGEERQWFKSKQGIKAQQTPRDISFCGHAILKDEIMIVKDATLDSRFSDNPLVMGNPKIRFYLGCPLKIKNKFLVGTLCIIDKKSRTFNKTDKKTMRDLADMVEGELENLHAATTDELTGLTNRRGFLSIAGNVFKQCELKKTDMIFLFFDLDKFKLINDTYGHAIGDEALKKFSELLSKNFRKTDIIARLGGDEFCILCYKFNEKMVASLIKRFDKAIHSFNQANLYKIEYSVGYVKYDKNIHTNVLDMLKEADNKMYAQKHKQDKKND